VRKAEQTSELMRWPERSSEISPVFVPSALPSSSRPGRLNLLLARWRWKSVALCASISESFERHASLSMQSDMLSDVSFVFGTIASTRLAVIATDLASHTLEPIRLTSCVRRWFSSRSLSVLRIVASLAYMSDAMVASGRSPGPLWSGRVLRGQAREL